MSEKRKPKYQIGDIVKLNAGGPDMAIQKLDPDYLKSDIFRGTYGCQWFAGRKLDNGVFPEENLVLVRKQGSEIDS